METTLNTNEKRLHFLAKHKIDSNSKSEKKKKLNHKKNGLNVENWVVLKREKQKKRGLKKPQNEKLMYCYVYF